MRLVETPRRVSGEIKTYCRKHVFRWAYVPLHRVGDAREHRPVEDLEEGPHGSLQLGNVVGGAGEQTDTHEIPGLVVDGGLFVDLVVLWPCFV